MVKKSAVALACAGVVLGTGLSTLPLAAQAQSAGRSQVVVGFKPGATGLVRAALAKAGGKVVDDLAEVDVLVVDLPSKAIAALQRHAKIDFVESVATRRILGGRAGLPRVGAATSAAAQVLPYGIPMVQADQLSDATAGNRTVCIVDSGIDGTHEDFAGVPMSGKNFTKSGDWNTDERAHGTHVAGTVAAVNNAVGVVGVAPNRHLNLRINKVFDASGSASSVTVARAMLDCWISGANVVSMSLGGDVPAKVEQRVVSLLSKRGLLLIAAAGNDGNNATSYPAGFAEVVSVAAIDENKVVADFSQFNADVELAAPGVGVLSTVPAFSQTAASLDVGGTGYPVQGMDGSPRVAASGALAAFGLGDTPVAGSMSGKICLISRGAISFAAKVVNCQNSGGVGAVIYNNTAGELFGTLGEIVTAIPSVGATQADGAAMLAQVGQTASVAVFGTPDLYASFNGTSMATPHVSAVASVVWSLNLGCTAEQVRSSMNKSAMDLGAAGRDVNYGYGLVQAKAANDRIKAQGCGN